MRQKCPIQHPIGATVAHGHLTRPPAETPIPTPGDSVLMIRSITAAAALVALAVPAGAQAQSAVAPAFGQTEVSLTAAAAKALTGAGVKVAPVGTTALPSGAIPFSITGSSSKAIAHTGGLKLSKGKRSLTLSNFRIVLKNGAPKSITAAVGKVRVPAFTLDAKKTKTTKDGLDTVVGPVGVDLSAVAVAAIKATLKVKLPKGYEIATANVKLQSAATRVTLDAGAAAALTSLGVTVSVDAPGVAGTSTIQFPITNAGGKIATTTPITHSGGLTFTAGTTTLSVGNFTIDAGAGLLYAETSPVGRLPLFKVDLSGATITKPGKQVVIKGAVLSLTATAAGALNSTFGVTAFTENLKIATADVVGVA